MPSKPVHSAYIELRVDDKKLASDISAAVAKAERKAQKIKVSASATTTSNYSSDNSGSRNADNFYRGFSGLATLYAAQRTIAATISVGSKFETGMAKISTLLNNVERKGISNLARDIKNIGTKYGQSFSTIQEAAYESLSAQISVNKLPKFLDVAARSGIAGGSDTKTAIDALTTIINSYGFAVEDAEKISDTLFKTIDRGKITYEQLAGSIGKVAAQSALAGISFEELTGAIASLTRAGIKPSEAMTSIYGLIAGFLNPTDESQQAAKKYGLDLNAKTLSSLGISGVSWALRDATPEDLLSIANQRKGFRALATLNNNLGSNAVDVGIMGKAMRGETSATEDAYKQFSKTFAVKMQGLANEVASYFIDSFEMLKPYVVGASEIAKRGILGLSNNNFPSRGMGTPFDNLGSEGIVSVLAEPLFYAWESMSSGGSPDIRPGNGASREDWQNYFAKQRKIDAGKLKAELARKASIDEYGSIPTYDTAALAKQDEEDRNKANLALSGAMGFASNVRKMVARAKVFAKSKYNNVVESLGNTIKNSSSELGIEGIDLGKFDFNNQLSFLRKKEVIEKQILSYKVASGEMSVDEYNTAVKLLNTKTKSASQDIELNKKAHDLDIKNMKDEIKFAEALSKAEARGDTLEIETLKIKEDFRKRKETLEQYTIRLKESGASKETIASVEDSIRRLSGVESTTLNTLKRDALPISIGNYSSPTSIEGVMRTIYPSTNVSSQDVEQEILTQIRNINDNFRRGVSLKESGGILRISF